MTSRLGVRSSVGNRGSAWLELLRPPNVTTAAADVLAGFAVASLTSLPALPYLLTATLSLYAGGIVLNDYFDRHLDATERPERPIPSGRVSATAAATAGFTLLAAGVTAAFFANAVAGLVACGIAGMVLLYDTWSKHHPIFGPVNMGLCRALNLLLGVAAIPAALTGHWFLAFLPLTYIAAVTVLSRGEVHGGKRGTARLCLVGISAVIAGLLALAFRQTAISLTAALITVLFAVIVIPPFWRAMQNPQPPQIRIAIKTGVLSLVLLDAAIGASFAGTVYALIILATAVLAKALANLYSVT